MTSPLLSTKLFIPAARASLVPRHHLVERLKAGVQDKLTLISAPAGFGKTTLLSSWIEDSDLPVAWFSRDDYPFRINLLFVETRKVTYK